MLYSSHALSLLVLLVGASIIATIILKGVLQRVGIPGLVGYMAMGFLLRVCNGKWAFLSPDAEAVLGFLAQVGVIALLFRIGLESNLYGLVRQLPRAGIIWIGNLVLSGLAGFGAARWLLGLGMIPSLFAGIALTATSVGVSMAAWRAKRALRSSNGELLVDTAELDDISGVGLMAILFAVVPALHAGGGPEAVLGDVSRAAGWFALKLAGFILLCFFFSRYLEARFTCLFKKSGYPETTMLLVVGSGFMIAAVAGWLGFSLAIGALFAGLLFSRDPDAVKFDTSFESLYELFTPFFFLGIGLSMDPGSLVAGMAVGSLLLVAAVVGKLLGAGGPALLTTGRTGALLIGLSMVPRAEIAMIIMQRGQALGDWAVPPQLFAGMVFVSAGTCVLIPWVLSLCLQRWPQTPES